MVRKRFGRYEIIRKLGRSMTDVYLAVDPVLKLRVVLKLIEQSRDHFTHVVIDAERRGAEIQRQLHEADRRVLEIYDFGERSGCFFVAMEYFEGRNIAEILEAERRIEPRQACRYAIEVLSQLERLHAFVSDVDGRMRAVVHGDIKPSNIQIAADGEVRLVDFGIAKVITRTKHLTHHNLGSPTYCSPERLEKSQVDPQADLWAVGVSLYEMVSGAVPYHSRSTRKLESLIQSRRPPRALPESCPPPLRSIILKALNSKIEWRYGSAAEFAADLRAFVDGRPTAAEREPSPSWDANETVRKPRSRLPAIVVPKLPALSKSTSSALRAIAIGAVLGLALVIPIHYFVNVRAETRPLLKPRDYSTLSVSEIAADWDRLQRVSNENLVFARLSSAPQLAAEMRTRLKAAADAVITKYRDSSDASIANFEWTKARTALVYALEIDPSDLDGRGKLALCDGYLNLIRNPQLPKADQSETSFQIAAADLPRAPDPHLALALFYARVFHNAGKTVAEFTEAERRDFRRGPRESELQADVYVARAEYEIRQARRAVRFSPPEENRWLRQASNDLDRARNLYEPIAGFSNVDAGLDKLYRDRESVQELNDALAEVQRKAAEQRSKMQRAKTRRPALHGGSFTYGDH
jgi:serine/threonine protein kinase